MPDASCVFAESSFGGSRADGRNGKSARYLHLRNGFVNGVVMGNGSVVSEPRERCDF